MLTAGALRAGGSRPRRPGGDPLPSHRALCLTGFRLLSLRFHRAEIRTRGQKLLVYQECNLGASPLLGCPSGSHLQNGTRSSAWKVGLRMKFNLVQAPGRTMNA